MQELDSVVEDERPEPELPAAMPADNLAQKGNPPTRGEVLRDQIEEFRSNLRALSSFVDNVEPVLQAQMDSTYEEHVRKLAAYTMFFEGVRSAHHGEDVEIDSFGWSVTIKKDQRDPEGRAFRLDGEPEDVNGFMEVVDDLARNPAKRREAAKRATHVPRQKTLLYETSLISLVSIVEWFYSQLMSSLYRWFPDRLNTGDACFSLRDLEGFETVADAVEQLIEDRVAKHVHESIDAWIDDLVKWFSIQPDTPVVADRAHIIEVVRRRDVFVHNGGRVSRLYLARVGREDARLIEGLVKGERLRVTSEYLDDAIDLLETAFISLAVAAWHKVGADDPGLRAAYLLDLSFDALCERKYRLAGYVSRDLSHDKAAPDWERTAARVNGWLARKYSEGLSAVRGEIDEFDDTALAEEFKVAKLALLEEHDRLLSDLPDLLDRRAVDAVQLRDWPLYMSLRESDYWPRVEELIAALDHNTPLDSAEAPELLEGQGAEAVAEDSALT